MQPRETHRSLFIPVLLIGIGIYAFLGALNIVPHSVFGLVRRFLPFMFLGLGIDLIWGRTRRWLGLGLAVVLCLGLVGFGIWANSNAVAAVQPFAEPRAGVRSAVIVLESNAGNVNVSALSADDGDLVRGSLNNSDARLDHRFTLDDGTAQINLATQRDQFLFPSESAGDWELGISPDVNVDLSLTLNAGELTADFASLDLRKLSIDINAGAAHIDLPDSGTIQLEVNAASLDLNLPADVAARITADRNATSINLPAGWTTKADVFTSPNWETATQRIEIALDASAASITIHQQ